MFFFTRRFNVLIMARMVRNRKWCLVFFAAGTFLLFILYTLPYLIERSENPVTDDNTWKQSDDIESDKRNQPGILVLSSLEKTRHQQQTLEDDGHRLQPSKDADKNNQALPRLNSSDAIHLDRLGDLIRRRSMQGFRLANHNGLIEFLEPASCMPLPASLLLYNRIFKTGSETLGLHFKSMANILGYEYTKGKFAKAL